jgi:predicted aspartyl protease
MDCVIIGETATVASPSIRQGITMLKRAEMGRVTVDFVAANNRDVVSLADGDRVLDHVKHLVVSGVVDSGAMRLVLPQRVVDGLGLKVDGETMVRYADNRREKRRMVSNVWLELLGRHSVFTAVVEPNRNDALIGAIVLEELDLLVDCPTQSLYPREPDSTLTEIE